MTFVDSVRRWLRMPANASDALVIQTLQERTQALSEGKASKGEPGSPLAPTGNTAVLDNVQGGTDQNEFHRLAVEVVEQGGVSLTEAYRELARRAPDAYQQYREAADAKSKTLADIDATGPGDDAVSEFTRLVKERMANDNLDIAAATRAVAIDYPNVYMQYRNASYAPEIPRGVK
jgi:hypothetical protein